MRNCPFENDMSTSKYWGTVCGHEGQVVSCSQTMCTSPSPITCSFVAGIVTPRSSWSKIRFFMSDFYLMSLLFFYFVLGRLCLSSFKEISFFGVLWFLQEFLRASSHWLVSCIIIPFVSLVVAPLPTLFTHLPSCSHSPPRTLPGHTSHSTISPFVYFPYVHQIKSDYIYFLTTYSLFLSLNFK